MEILKFIYDNWVVSIIFLFGFYEIISLICNSVVKSVQIKYGEKAKKSSEEPTVTNTRNAPTKRPRPSPGPTPPKTTKKSISLEKETDLAKSISEKLEKPENKNADYFQKALTE